MDNISLQTVYTVGNLNKYLLKSLAHEMILWHEITEMCFNKQRNNMIKNKQISFEVTRAWDSFITWNYWNVFKKKYNYITLNGGCY